MCISFSSCFVSREHKSLQSSHDKAELKKVSKIKYNSSNLDEKNNFKPKSKSEKPDIDSQHQANANLTNIINRALKKTTSSTKRIPSRNINNSAKNIETATTNDEKYYSNPIKGEKLLQRSKSYLNHNNHHNYNHNSNSGDQLLHDQSNNAEFNDINVRRYSTNEMDINRQYNTKEASKRMSTTSKRLHRSAMVLNKTENEMNAGNAVGVSQHTPPPTIKTFIRHTKSEVMPLTNTPSSDTAKAQERFCYERRLKKLEEEIERYKNEVKSFCREKFKNTTQLQKPQQEEKINHREERIIPTRSYNYKTTPKKLSSTASTPIKNIYFQLLTKGQHHDYHKSELDLSGNSGNGSSSDHFRNSFNSNSCSVRSKNSTKVQYEKITSTQQLPQHQDNEMQKQHNPYRCRPISKFV